MLTYELEGLSAFTDTLSPRRLAALELTPENFSQWSGYLDMEISRVKNALLEQYLGGDEAEAVRRSLRQHQARLVELSDRVCAYLRSRVITGQPVRSLYLGFLSQVDELLDWYRQQLAQYFDWDIKIPDLHKAVLLPQLRQRSAAVLARLQESNTDTALLAVLGTFLHNVTLKQHLTYRSLGFAERLLDGLNGNKPVNTSTVLALLFNLNLNSLEVLNWYHAQIEDRLAAADGFAAQMDVLIAEEKLLQLYQPARIAAHRDLPALKKMALAYVRKQRELLREQVKVRKLEHELNALPENSFRLQVGLNGGQLGFLLRVLVVCGIILNDNVKELLQMASRYCYSKKDKFMSYATLDTAFYRPERTIISGLLDKVIIMMNWINTKKREQ